MKTLLASALFLALGMTAHADCVSPPPPTVNITDFLEWQSPEGMVYEDLSLQGPATDDGSILAEDETVFEYGEYGAHGDVAVWPVPWITDPVPVWSETSQLYFWGEGQSSSVPEPHTIPLLLCAMAVLIGFRKYVKTKVA